MSEFLRFVATEIAPLVLGVIIGNLLADRYLGRRGGCDE